MAARQGISALFGQFPKDMTLYERAKITVKRHQHDYFKEWDEDRFETEEIPASWRPLVIPVTTEAYELHVKKNEALRNRKLAFCLEMASDRTNEWAVQFRRDIKDGKMSSVTQIKDLATDLWKQNSSTYDKSRAVHMPCGNGRGFNIRKTRVDGETEAAYRRRVRERNPESESDAGVSLQSVLDTKPDLTRLVKMNKQQLTNYLTNSEGFNQLNDLQQLQTRSKEECLVSAIMASFVDNL